MSESRLRTSDSYWRHAVRGLFGAAILTFVCPSLGLGQGLRTTSDLLQDQVETLVPKKPRTEADEDRLLAAAQFTHGRMLLQREKSAEALVRFERAFRYDPSPVIARDIIAIASQLNRHAEAVRYAVLSAELQLPEGDLPLRLAGILAEQEKYTRASALLERSLQPRDNAPSGLTAVLIRAELMRLYLLAEKFEQAAQSAEVVRTALQQPEQSGIEPADQKKLAEQRARLDTLIAECFLRGKRYADAEAMFQASHQARPDEAVLGFHLARSAVEQKKWKLARERLEPYFRGQATSAGLEPYELLVQAIRGETTDAKQANTEVLSTLRKLRETDPKNNALGYFTAAEFFAGEDWDAAAKIYEELLSRQPTTTAYQRLAAIYQRKADFGKLLELIGLAVDQSGSRELFSAKDSSLVNDAGLLDQLVERLRAPVKSGASPPTAKALTGVSLLAIGRKKMDIAREMYDKAVATSPPDLAEQRELIAVAALVEDEYGFAIDVLQQAIAEKPPQDKLANLNFYLSGALEFAGRTDDAVLAAEKCATLKRDFTQFQSRAAWILYHAKRLAPAEDRYRDLLARFDLKYEPPEIRDEVRRARLTLSNLCVLQDRLPEAEEWLEQVLDEFPEDAGALNDLGYLWADQGKKLQRALRMVEQAVAAEPDNFAYRDSLGWAYYRLGRYSDAVSELERAAAGAPDGVIFDHLGDTYLKLDQRSKALEAWRKAVELMQEGSDAPQRAAAAAKIKQHSDSVQ